MYRIQCAEVWGGTSNIDQDVCSGGVTASLHSAASDGGRGGDIYYLSVCGKDNLTRVVLADVVGHGAAVSAVSERLYSVLLEQMNDTSNHLVLANLNRFAAEQGIDAMTTAAVVGFYTTDSNLYFSYAGHSPALVWRRAARHWGRLDLDGQRTEHANAPLGIDAQYGFDQQSVPLVSGDRVFLYTDGLVEARSREGAQYGEPRLLETLNRSAEQPLAALKRSVLDDVSTHAQGCLQHDDLTVLAMEIR